jgi:hypothetical protein
MIFTSLLLNMVLLVATYSELPVMQFPSKGKTALSLGMKAKADVERAGTVTKVLVQLEDLRPPQTVLAGMNSYVVWAVSPEGSFDNLGELEISERKGFLEATTRFDRFAILITAEPHYMVDTPGMTVVFKNEPHRTVPSVPTRIELGAYEYANLPKSAPNTPALIVEARAAIAIAVAAQADRLAPTEMRQARVSLETMEELLKRSSPADVVAASAHEAIRRGQRAVVAARQSAR